MITIKPGIVPQEWWIHEQAHCIKCLAIYELEQYDEDNIVRKTNENSQQLVTVPCITLNCNEEAIAIRPLYKYHQHYI